MSNLLQSPPAAGHAPRDGLQHRGAAAQSDQEDTGGVGSGMGVVGGALAVGWIAGGLNWTPLSTPVGS